MNLRRLRGKSPKKKIIEGDDATLAAAKKYTDSNVNTLNTNAASNLAVAKSYADTVSSNALASAESYTDDKVTALQKADASTLSSAKSYADTVGSNTLTSAKSYANTVGSNSVTSSNSHADTLVTNLRNDGKFNGNVTAKGGNLYLGSYRIYVG